MGYHTWPSHVTWLLLPDELVFSETANLWFWHTTVGFIKNGQRERENV